MIFIANNCITTKGSFYAAIPGGSVLKMLNQLPGFVNEVDWSKVHMYSLYL